MEPVPGLMERRDSGQRYGWFGPGSHHNHHCLLDSVGLTYGLAIVTVDVLLEPPVALHLTHLDADSGHLLAPGVRVGLVAVGAVQDVGGGDLLLLLLDLFLSRSLG